MKSRNLPSVYLEELNKIADGGCVPRLMHADFRTDNESTDEKVDKCLYFMMAIPVFGIIFTIALAIALIFGVYTMFDSIFKNDTYSIPLTLLGTLSLVTVPIRHSARVYGEHSYRKYILIESAVGIALMYFMNTEASGEPINNNQYLVLLALLLAYIITTIVAMVRTGFKTSIISLSKIAKFISLWVNTIVNIILVPIVYPIIALVCWIIELIHNYYIPERVKSMSYAAVQKDSDAQRSEFIAEVERVADSLLSNAEFCNMVLKIIRERYPEITKHARGGSSSFWITPYLIMERTFTYAQGFTPELYHNDPCLGAGLVYAAATLFKSHYLSAVNGASPELIEINYIKCNTVAQAEITVHTESLSDNMSWFEGVHDKMQEM